jgi:hypothetical protein
LTPRPVDCYTHPNIPQVLYRYFDEADHAERFARGDIRIGTLSNCRRAEATLRRDELEGTLILTPGFASGSSADPKVRAVAERSDIRIEGDVHDITIDRITVVREVTDLSLLCFTSEKWTPMVPGDSRHGVEIRSPKDFFLRVTQTLGAAGPVTSAVLSPVWYIPENTVRGALDPVPPMGFAKDRDKWEDQKEVRIVWSIHVPAGRFLEPHFMSCPDVAELCTLLKVS